MVQEAAAQRISGAAGRTRMKAVGVEVARRALRYVAMRFGVGEEYGGGCRHMRQSHDAANRAAPFARPSAAPFQCRI